MVNKTNAAEYYYTEFNLLNPDLISDTAIKILDSANYTTKLTMNGLADIAVNADTNATPWLKAEINPILQINNCSNITVNGLSFENKKNSNNYYYLRADNSSGLTIKNCIFTKSSNKKSTFLRLANIQSSSVENCEFAYTETNKKNIGILLYTAEIDNAVILTNNIFNKLEYGIRLNVGNKNNPAVTISNSLFQNNKYNIDNSNTNYQFNNINNTFI